MSEQENKVVSAEEVEVAATENVMAALVEHSDTDPVVSTKILLEAGSHFGHQTKRWNPKMKPFIYGARNGIYIIDLVKTQKKLQVAYVALKKIVKDGGKVLFIGTKKQASDAIYEEALRSGSFYVNTRWLGGTITNFNTIKDRTRKLKELEQKELNGEYELMPKKEAVLAKKLQEKLASNLTGIKEMRKNPDAIVIVDPTVEKNAIAEARIKHIPVFGLVDTNCNPDLVDYVIPANDDATKSIRLLVGLLADAVVEAKGGVPSYAYNFGDAQAVVEMEDALKDVDKTEEIRMIKQKAREDNFASKNKGRGGNSFVKKRPFEKKEVSAAPVAVEKM